MTKDSKAQEERAKQILEDVKKATEGASTPATSEKETQPPKPESPRDFVHRRMRELDKDKKT